MTQTLDTATTKTKGPLNMMSVGGYGFTPRQQAQALLIAGKGGTFRMPTLMAALQKATGSIGPEDDRAADRLLQRAKKLGWIEQETRGNWRLLDFAVKELREIASPA